MTALDDLHIGYVRTPTGVILVQLPEANDWGFTLADEHVSWPGGFGIAETWQCLDFDDPRISRADHDRLDWLLDG